MDCKNPMKQITIIKILILFNVKLTLQEKTEVEREFESYSIVPDFILKCPHYTAKITYPNDLNIEMSQKYDPNLLQDAPAVAWEADPNKYYVLTMVDIDIPTAEYRAESAYKHWLVVNIPGNDTYMGQALTEYQGPRPEPSTTHRIVTLVYEQERPCNFYDIFIDKNTIENRFKFSVSAYAWKYKLSVYAGTFFRCDYVSTTSTEVGPPTQETTTDASFTPEGMTPLDEIKEKLGQMFKPPPSPFK